MEQVQKWTLCVQWVQKPTLLKNCQEGGRVLGPSLALAPATGQSHVTCSDPRALGLLALNCSLLTGSCNNGHPPHPHPSCGFPGGKVLEPLWYTQIAVATFVSSKRVVGRTWDTMSLFSCCIGKGKTIVFVLRM